MVSETRLTVKPEVVHLDDLFQEIERGQIRIPNFQRPFVWSERMMRELFDSVIKGYPIGSLLIWEPNEVPSPAKHKSIGPFPSPEWNGRTRFVIDGYQRLTTLYSVLKKDDILKGSKDNWIYIIYFNIQTKRIEHHRGDQSSNFEVVPLHSLWHTDDLIEVSTLVRNRFPDNHRVIIRDLQKIFNDLHGYKIAVNRMSDGSMKDAIDIFTRLNSTGKKVSEVQMLNALTGTNLDIFFANFRDELKKWSFDKIDEKHLMTALYLSTEKDINSMNPTTFIEIAKSDLHQNQLAEATRKGLGAAAEFLRMDLNVPGIEWVPYVNQFLWIAEFFRLCPTPDSGQVAMLKRWFWTTSYQGWFAGANFQSIRESLRDIRDLAKSSNNEFKSLKNPRATQPFPSEYKKNSARVKTFYLFYLGLRPTPFSGLAKGYSDPVQLLADLGADGLNPISLRLHRNSIGNLFISEKSASTGAINTQILNETIDVESHGVSADAKKLLEAFQYEDFERSRIEYLSRLEAAFIEGLGLSPASLGDSQEPREDSELD